jgi:hypothetical protein
VEAAFRQTKAGLYGNLRPIWHWTDGKIRCQILCCIISLTYLRILELWLGRAGLPLTSDRMIDRMRTLHSCVCWNSYARKPHRLIKDPTPEQVEILAAVAFKTATRLLQPIGA